MCDWLIAGDVDGTVDAILDILDTYHSDLCHLHLLSYGVGDITEHDVDMAAAFNGKSTLMICTSTVSHGVWHFKIAFLAI